LERTKEVNKFSSKYSWVLKLSTSKPEYFIGDTITLSFKLKNIGDDKKEILIYKNFPNFKVSVEKKVLSKII
ncbi:MAG: hypothetical protein V1773_04705, partial [bacterium]